MALKSAIEYVPSHYVGQRRPVRKDCGTETKTEQHHRDDTNINKIISRYTNTGVLPPGRELQYADVSQVGELLDVKMAMENARNMYEELPDHIKEKLPIADIGNVTNESLQEIFDELQNPDGQPKKKEDSPTTGVNQEQPVQETNQVKSEIDNGGNSGSQDP